MLQHRLCWISVLLQNIAVRASFTKVHPCVIDTKGVIWTNLSRQLVLWTCGIGIVICCVFFYDSLSAAVCFRNRAWSVRCFGASKLLLLFFFFVISNPYGFATGADHSCPKYDCADEMPTVTGSIRLTIAVALVRHLYKGIKLSDAFPCYHTTPCLGNEGRIKRQKVCHDKCYAPRNKTAVYVWRKGSKWSLFTGVQVVW